MEVQGAQKIDVQRFEGQRPCAKYSEVASHATAIYKQAWLIEISFVNCMIVMHTSYLNLHF